MHPGDVAEFVADSVEELKQQLQRHPQLRVNDVLLEGDVHLYIGLVVETKRMTQDAPFVLAYNVPVVGAPATDVPLILYLELTDFDGQPPTAELLQTDRSPLPPDQWPKALGQQAVIPQHRDFSRPFFCRPGLREFHTHPQHEDQPWDKYREGFSLSAIVIDLLFLLQDRHAWSFS